MSFRDRLKEARIAKGLKQVELSEKIGLSKNAVSNYENGSSNPNVDVLYKLFDALEVDPNFLFQDEIPIHKITLTTIEKQLIINYRKLSKIAQQKTDEYINDLLENPKYTKSTIPNSTPKKPTTPHKQTYTAQIAAQGHGVEDIEVNVDMDEVQKIYDDLD